jgi:endonuclease
MRLVIATCSVDYEGRLSAHLPTATRLLLIKADGSISIHSDDRAFKPLNWMNPPCSFSEQPGRWVIGNPKGETLTITLHEVHQDISHQLGTEPGLQKDGVEAQLQELLSLAPSVIEEGLSLVRREHPTDIGPVDLLCRDADGRAVAVEVKRVGEIASIEQVLRYAERLDLDGRLRPVRCVVVAQQFKPQAKVFAESRSVRCVTVDYDDLRGAVIPVPTLF